MRFSFRRDVETLCSLRRKCSLVTVNSHSATLTASGDGRSQGHRRTNPMLRNDFNLPAELFGTAAYAFQSLTGICVCFIESMTVILQSQDDRSALDLQRRCGRLASRMPRDVVYSFLLNQKDFAAHLC